MNRGAPIFRVNMVYGYLLGTIQKDMRCPFSSTNKIETCCHNMGGFTSSSYSSRDSHLEEIKCSVNTHLVQFHLSCQLLYSFLTCRQKVNP